jgi:hypothetical protein
MTDANWPYECGEVLRDDDDRWWHVLSRYRDVDTGKRFYRLADATHTEYKDRAHADWIEGDFESDEWNTNTKPAAERGYRVNGRLVGPSQIQHAKGNECLHEQQCPNCGSDGKGEIDIINDHAEERAYGECRVCNEMWEIDDE